MNTATEWRDSPEHPGYKVKEIKHGNCTIQVFRPELDKVERVKREASIKAVAEKTLFNYYRRKEQTS
jgi:hypothetical protein